MLSGFPSMHFSAMLLGARLTGISELLRSERTRQDVEALDLVLNPSMSEQCSPRCPELPVTKTLIFDSFSLWMISRSRPQPELAAIIQ
jgi:hypothetical protein